MCAANSNSLHRPQGSPNSLRENVANHPALAQGIEDFFTILKSQNTQSAFEFSEDLETNLDRRNGHGILTEMAKPQNGGNEWRFEELRHETMSLMDLKGIVENGMTFPAGGTFWRTFETVMVNHLSRDFEQLIRNEQKTQGLRRDFMDYINNSSGILALLNAVELYINNLNNAEQKATMKKLFQNYKISFHTIKRELESAGVDLSSTDQRFSQWSDDAKTFFDGALTQIVVDRVHDRVRDMADLIEGSERIFSKVLPPFGALFKNYPFKHEDLKARYPEKWRVIENLQAQLTLNEEQAETINRQIEQAELNIYLEDVEAQNPQLAGVLRQLIETRCDFSQLSNQQMQVILNDLVEQGIAELRRTNLIRIFGQYTTVEFEEFFRNLYTLDHQQLQLGTHTLQISKRIKPGSTSSLQRLEDLEKVDALPLTFTISGLNASTLSLENRDLVEKLFATEMSEDRDSFEVSDRDIGKLFYLFLMSQGNIVADFERAKGEKTNLDKLFANNGVSCIDRYKVQLYAPDDTQTPENQQETVDVDREILDFWNEIKGEKTDNIRDSFAPGAVLYVPFLESELPPHRLGSKESVRIDITNVDRDNKTVNFKMHGTEFDLSSKDEGAEQSLDFDTFTKKLKEQSDLMKILPGKSKEKEVFSAFAACDLDASKFGGVQIKDGKLIFQQVDDEGKENEVEATYFSAMDEMPDEKGSGIRSDNILYKVQMLGNDKVEISGKVPDIKGETKKYKRTMSLSDFLLFVANKNLQPKTKEQAELELQAMKDVPSKVNRKWSFYSISSMSSAIKTVWKNMKSKVNAYYKEQDDACLSRLVNDFAIYDKIKNAVPFAASVASASDTLADEARSKLESSIWSNIETWLKKFESMNDFATFFRTGKDDLSGRSIESEIGKGNTLQKILESGKSVVNDSSLRPIMAAAMLANLNKGGGLYRNVQGGENRALWIRCLLGYDHYIRYMNQKNIIVAKIKSGAPDADQLQDRLKTSELDYIINNIRGGDGGLDFGGFIDPNRALKSAYSSKFASSLEDFKKKSQNTPETIESEYKNLAHNNFNKAFNDFKLNIKTGRFEKGIANLMKMASLTGRDAKRLDQVKRGFTFVVLSGMMNRYGGDKATRKFFDSLAVTLQIPTAFGTRQWNHRDNARHLMDKIPPAPGQLKFSEFMAQKGLKKSDFSSHSGNLDYNALMDNLWTWRSANNSNDNKQIDNYFQSLFIKEENQTYDSVEAAVNKQLWKKQSDNIYPGFANDPFLMGIESFTKGSQVYINNMQYDRNGFSGESVDARNAKALFWVGLKKDLKSIESKASPETMLNLFLKIFNNAGFGESNYSKCVSWIKTARAVKARGTGAVSMRAGDTEIYAGNYTGNEANVLLDYLFRGGVLESKSVFPPSEIEEVLGVFVSYFQKHLTEMDDTLLTKVFGKDTMGDANSKGKILIPWNEYNKYKLKNSLFDDEEEKEDKKSALGKKKKELYNEDAVLNKKIVDLENKLHRIGVSTASLSGRDISYQEELFQQVYGTAA